MPSGCDPMGGNRFSEKVMLKTISEKRDGDLTDRIAL
jgi:hypothetical protein